MAILAGIDYSMNSPAICVYNTENPLTFENLRFFNRSDFKTRQGVYSEGMYVEIHPLAVYGSDEERYHLNAAWATEILVAEGVQRVAFEGYSMGSNSGLVFNIAENTGALKQMIWKEGIELVEPPSPGAVKKYHTGKGNATKPVMITCFEDELMVQFYQKLGWKPKEAQAKPIDDLVDSYAIMKCAFHLGENRAI